MTRKMLSRRLWLATIFLFVLIGLALLFRLQPKDSVAGGLYEFIRDMSLLIATLMGVYLANIYQRRTVFLQSLREQWRDIVNAKAEALSWCHVLYSCAPDTMAADPALLDRYRAAYYELSRCIDHMRIVYKNVGETDQLVGYYPYEPLHDMRRAMEDIHPLKTPAGPAAAEQAAQRIGQAFMALREHFLDEFDLEEPTQPLLTPGAGRQKRSGASMALPGVGTNMGTNNEAIGTGDQTALTGAGAMENAAPPAPPPAQNQPRPPV